MHDIRKVKQIALGYIKSKSMIHAGAGRYRPRQGKKRGPKTKILQGIEHRRRE